MNNLYGGIEAGGTKFVCAVGTNPNDLQITQFDTTTPQETLTKAVKFFKDYKLNSIGVGTFGPVDLDKNSNSYGFITSTPKPGWSNTDFVGVLKREFDIPIGFDTDVNTAALGEHFWGAAKNLTDFIYLTIGTGIGGGGMMNGKLMHGLVHPEMGHIFIPRDSKDEYKGKCPFHQNLCFEGLASGPAIEERWGKPAKELNVTHDAWELESFYISLALVNFICTLSPRRIILGGGVMEQKQLFQLIHKRVNHMLNRYIQSPEILGNINHYIVPPALGKNAGVLGAIALAKQQ